MSVLSGDKAQIRPCLKHSSHHWRGASKHYLDTMNAIQKRDTIKLIDDPILTVSIDSLTFKEVSPRFPFFYRNAYYHRSWDKIDNCPSLPKPVFYANSEHVFAVKLENCRPSSFTYTFIPMTRSLSPPLCFATLTFFNFSGPGCTDTCFISSSPR